MCLQVPLARIGRHLRYPYRKQRGRCSTSFMRNTTPYQYWPTSITNSLAHGAKRSFVRQQSRWRPSGLLKALESIIREQNILPLLHCPISVLTCESKSCFYVMCEQFWKPGRSESKQIIFYQPSSNHPIANIDNSDCEKPLRASAVVQKRFF